MKITSLPDVEPRPRRVAVGMFDGVHRGHRAVIEGADTVVTFDPHPTSVLAPATAPQLLTTVARKAELLAAIGVQELVVVPFDAHFAAQSAQWFMDEVLVAKLGATHVSIGENFRFGQRAQGTPAVLQGDDRFQTRSPCWNSTGRSSPAATSAASSSAGRSSTPQLLGVPFVVDGPVQHGRSAAASWDSRPPTRPQPGMIVPAFGVYACRPTATPPR